MKPGVLDLKALTDNYVCVVQMKTQLPGVLHQITLRPDKVHDGIIRVGETPRDEINGWQYPQNIEVIAVLCRAVFNGEPGQERDPTKWSTKPLLEVVEVLEDEVAIGGC